MLSILVTTVATPEKWPWTVGSLEYLTNPADAHGGGEPARVDLGNVRDEQHVRAALLGQPGVPLLVSRVGRQVNRLVELARVDEQPHHDNVGGCPGRSDQRKVPVVERPMVGTKATVPWPGSSARTSAMVRTVLIGRSPRRAHWSSRVSKSGARSCKACRWEATV